MARKVVNRKELRRENDAAERSDAKPAKKAPVKRKSRAKANKEVRLKAFWGVFNQSLKRMACSSTANAKQPTKKPPS